MNITFKMEVKYDITLLIIHFKFILDYLIRYIKIVPNKIIYNIYEVCSKNNERRTVIPYGS